MYYVFLKFYFTERCIAGKKLALAGFNPAKLEKSGLFRDWAAFTGNHENRGIAGRGWLLKRPVLIGGLDSRCDREPLEFPIVVEGYVIFSDEGNSSEAQVG